MAARTADPAFYPSLSAQFTDAKNTAAHQPPAMILDDPLGAFRGLGFAIVLQVLFGIIGVGIWEVLRRLF
ncbi:MAG: hypothetical protein WA294_08450 [Acidobacteriaceae bacterium]